MEAMRESLADKLIRRSGICLEHQDMSMKLVMKGYGLRFNKVIRKTILWLQEYRRTARKMPKC